MCSAKRRTKREKAPKKELFSLDRFYQEAYRHLVYDLASDDEHLLKFGLARLVNPRCEAPLGYHGVGDAGRFKRWYQIDAFPKRIIFSSDPSFRALSTRSLRDFETYQTEERLPEAKSAEFLPLVAKEVRRILGPFDLDKFCTFCEWGKKAASHLPRKRSYLDMRVENLNGSQVQKNWFNEVRVRDIHLLRATRKGMKSFLEVNRVEIDAVPKSWKAARIIGLDSTVGGFLSKGLGNYMRHRLEASTPIDLALQQERHKIWAREGSIDGHLATIDMSKASDSFTVDFMKMVLPSDWFPIVEAVRMPRYLTREELPKGGNLTSAMLMGSGHTFPLQTILFYALALCATRLSKQRGIVSVYGDDIIVPNLTAQPLMGFLRSLGFSVNMDKSFWDNVENCHLHTVKFRESCGGDYYAGVDVRPFCPECETCSVPKHTYIAEVHKFYNGLLRRWHPLEVEQTVHFLLSLLDGLCKVTFVPDDQPETAGLMLSTHWWVHKFLDSPVNLPYLADGIVRFCALRTKARTRIGASRAHYWAWLRKHRGTRPENPLQWRTPDNMQDQPWDRNSDPGPTFDRVGSQFGREALRGERLRYSWVKA